MFAYTASLLTLLPSALPANHDLGILDAYCGWPAKHAFDP